MPADPARQGSPPRSRRRLLELACICFAAAQIGWFVLPGTAYFQNADWQMRDTLIRLSTIGQPAPGFVFLAIDESSLRLDHLWPEDLTASPALEKMAAGFPWPRDVYAAALDRIFAAGARLVIIDLILDKPRDGDPELRAALDRYADRVVVASNYSINVGDPARPEDDAPTLTMPTLTLIPEPDDDPRVGYANFWPTPSDSIVRQAVYATTLSERLGKPPAHGERVHLSLSGAALRLLGLPLPEATEPFFRLRAWAVPEIPFHALFVPYEWRQNLQDGALLRDKIVIIGPSASRLQDFHLTPLGRMAGPMVHVHALAAAMERAFYQPVGEAGRVLAVAAAALLALLVSARLARRPIAALAALLGAGALYLGLAWALAWTADLLLHPVQPLAVLALAGTSCIAWNFARERRESGRMRSMLERYVSRNLVREVLDHREDFLDRLGGTRTPVTVFFSDVRGFTTRSENEDPHRLVGQLNEYLGEMVRIVFQHQGTLDKFMGDGIMAVWGNVVSEGPAQDAARALQAALDMLARLAELNARWAERGLPPFHIGIGLHHGEVIFGNIGSEEKAEPTVIGDTVNLASRVEGLTKKYGVTLCITDALAALIRDRFRLRAVDLVQVVGKSQPVEILTVLGPADLDVRPGIAAYEAGLTAYRARRFAEAQDHFRAALAVAPDDKLSALYATRCEAFLATPPPPDWNGTEVATNK